MSAPLAGLAALLTTTAVWQEDIPHVLQRYDRVTYVSPKISVADGIVIVAGTLGMLSMLVGAARCAAHEYKMHREKLAIFGSNPVEEPMRYERIFPED